MTKKTETVIKEYKALSDREKYDFLKSLDQMGGIETYTVGSQIDDFIRFMEEDEFVEDEVEADILDSVVSRIKKIEHSELLSGDEEIEIENYDGDIYVSRYSAERESAIEIERLCSEDEIDINELIRVCDKNDWLYVM